MRGEPIKSMHQALSCCCGQITMKFNHNGTHIEGLGLKHGEHRVIININAHDTLEGMRAAFYHVLAAWRHAALGFLAAA